MMSTLLLVHSVPGQVVGITEATYEYSAAEIAGEVWQMTALAPTMPPLGENPTPSQPNDVCSRGTPGHDQS